MIQNKSQHDSSYTLNHAKAAGFTLVELLMAMTFFSFMMVILSVGVLQIMRIYQSGVSTRRTQQSARIAIEDITREVRSATHAEADQARLCLEGTQAIEYRFTNNGLLKTAGSGSCQNGVTGNQTVVIDGSNVTQSGVRLAEFIANIIYANDNPASVEITITVTTGADDLLEDGTSCKPGTGSQYCASTSYSNIISMRGGQ